MGSLKIMAWRGFSRIRTFGLANAQCWQTRHGGGPSVRKFSTSTSRNRYMPAWVINQYGTNEVVTFTEEADAPGVNNSHDVLVKVHAASINPIDISMRGGYGATLLKLRRDPLNLLPAGAEFPIILGRDVSGVVLECGSSVTHFKPGDEVWAAIPPWKQGGFAELVTLTDSEVSFKPQSLSHAEAASLPYVATTALSALTYAGGLDKHHCANKRILIIGASGGVGTFSVQLLKAWEAHVTATGSHSAVGLLSGLGVDHVVDYTAGDVPAQLESVEKFDVVLDNVGGDTESWALGLLKPWAGAKYVTLVTPLLWNMDTMGMVEGTLQSGYTLSSKAMQNLCNGVFYRWGFYAPDGPALDEVSQLVDGGKILPVVEALFPFSQLPRALEKVELGHARGKTVVTVVTERESQATEGVDSGESEEPEEATATRQ